jgi:hypothetical protein
VRRLTFVAFLPDGRCVAVPDGAGVRLPTGAVRSGEHYLLDTALRVPLEDAGFRPQRVHPFAAAGTHVYAWLDGDRYTGRRPHATVELVVGSAEEIAAQLDASGRPPDARAVLDGAQSFRTQSDDDYYADNLRLLEPAYLRGTTPWEGSGFGGDAARWRAHRECIVDGIHRDGTFLDLGCANGLLMESVHAWAAERGLAIEPYGVDIAPRLVDLARRRLPQWANRIDIGNAIDYRPPGGRRFTFVHTLLDSVPTRRRADLIRHTRTLVEPAGRLLISHYPTDGGTDHTAPEHVRRLGFHLSGHNTTTAWIDA